MPATDFSALFETLKKGVADLATTTLRDYVAQATTDGLNALNTMQTDLERWTEKLASGRLTIDDVRFLMQGKKELMQMKALQQAGLAQIRLDTFRNSLIDMVIGTMSKAL